MTKINAGERRGSPRKRPTSPGSLLRRQEVHSVSAVHCEQRHASTVHKAGGFLRDKAKPAPIAARTRVNVRLHQTVPIDFPQNCAAVKVRMSPLLSPDSTPRRVAQAKAKCCTLPQRRARCLVTPTSSPQCFRL
ncbi:hypothetical protein GN956_G4854 [Arapaima gigas]